MKNGLRAIVLSLGLGVVSFAATIGALHWINRAPSLTEEVDFPESILAEEDDFVADLRAAAEIIRQRWSYLELRRDLEGIEIDQLEREALDLLGSPPEPATFQRALTYLVAGLHDGHGWARAAEYSVPGAFRWPFTLLEVREGLMLDAIDASLVEFDEELTLPPSLERGWTLLAVDGRPVDACIADAERFVFASTGPARRVAAITHMARFDDAPRRVFRLRDLQGVELELELVLPPSYKSISGDHALPQTPLHKMLEDDFAYFRPGSFSPPEDSGWPGPPEKRDEILRENYEAIDSAIADLASARALLLDLRNNPGGTDLLGQFLIDRLVDSGYVYSKLSNRSRFGWNDFSSQRSRAAAGQHELRVPLVCLVDEMTFSTADNVAACLADVHPNAKFVGRPNGAGSGAPRSFQLPRTGSSIYFCTMRVQSPSGMFIEGHSVPLDSHVRWSREDVIAGRDPDVEEALRLLSR